MKTHPIECNGRPPILRLIHQLLCGMLIAGLGAGLLSVPALAEISEGQPFDLQGFIDQKMAEGETYIRLPEGRHRVETASNRAHLTLTGFRDITIDGTGAELICTTTTRAINITNCHNFTLIGLKIDYDPLPFTQGRIISMSADKRTLQIEIMEGYPEATSVTGSKLEIFDYASGELVTTTYYNVSYVTNPDSNRVTANKPANYSVSISKEKVGDIAVMTSAYVTVGSIPHAILINGCSNVTLQDVTLYSANMFGFFETNSSNSRYIRCVVDRRPLEDDLRVRAHPRMRSLEADAFHSKFAGEGPTYLECIARYNGDDGIAINGDYHIITATNGAVLRVIGKMGAVPNLPAGTPVELVSYTGERIDDAVITTFAPAGAITVEETQFLQSIQFSGDVTKTAQARNVWAVTLDREVSLPRGSVIAHANRIGNGFEVRNCTIGPNRSRGILIKSSNGIVSGNHLVDNWGQAIKMAPEYLWLEAGSGSNLTIADNTIVRCHDVAIAVTSTAGNGSTSPAGAHRDVRVIGNAISHSTNPAIAITSTRGLKLYDNTVTSSDNSLLAPWLSGQFGRSQDPSRQIYLLNNEDSVTQPPASQLEAWRDRYHIAQDGSEDLHDFSGDGIPALLNFAFAIGDPRDKRILNSNLDLDAPEHGGFPILTAAGSLSYHFVRLRGDSAGFSYSSEYSPDLGLTQWEPIESFPALFQSITSLPIAGSDYDVVSVLLANPPPANGFFRVRITAP